MSDGRRVAVVGATILLVLACVLRWLHLEADPYYYLWMGHVSDEGRWLEHARRVSMGGPWLTSAARNEHLMLAPLFSGMGYAAFESFGVDRGVARILPAISGCGLLILLVAFLRRRVHAVALFAGLAALALQPDFFWLSRVAIPEMPVALGALGAFTLLHGATASRPRNALAGAVAALMVATKATHLPLVAGFALVAFARRPGELRAGDGERWKDAASFLCGVAALGIPACALALAVWPTPGDGLGSDVSTIAKFLYLKSPKLIAYALFGSNVVPALALGTLGAWLAWWVRAASPPTDSENDALIRGATLWAGFHAAMFVLMGYFPARYAVHLLVPCAILLALGLDGLTRHSLSELCERIARSPGLRGRLARVLVWGPTALWCAAPVGALAVLAGPPPGRMRVRAVVVVVCLLGAWLLARRARLRPESLRFAIAFPWVAAALWYAGWALHPGAVPFWANAPSGALWLLVGWGASLLAAWGLSRGASPRPQWAPLFGAVFVSLLFFLHSAPGLIRPSYAIRDISRDLASLGVMHPPTPSGVGKQRVSSSTTSCPSFGLGGAIRTRWYRSVPA